MSRMPQVPTPDSSLLRGAREPLFDLDVSVVTPLFGGGATAGVADPLAPVRAASVRGHLRFWWRACKSAGFATADALFDQEEAIWGSTAYPSPVAVIVSLLSSGTKVESREYQRRADGRFPAYALFPTKTLLARRWKTCDSSCA